jgi:GNAT superfamily N-acetyltransferase
MAGLRRTDGIEIDDDPARVDLRAVHTFLSEQSYWARGRDLATVTRLVREATRVVGAYEGASQVGFARCLSDGVSFAWIADVYVVSDRRGRRIGEDVVRHLIEGSPFAHVRWMLGTADAHSFYAQFGFGAPGPRVLERPRAGGDPPVP